MVIPNRWSWEYVPKNDVRHVIKRQRIMQGVVFVIISVVMVMMHVRVVPKLLAMYSEYEMALPGYFWLMIYVSYAAIAGGLGVGGYLLVTEPDYSKAAHAEKFAKHGMVRTRDILSTGFELYLRLLILVLCLTIIAIVKPMNFLTGSL